MLLDRKDRELVTPYLAIMRGAEGAASAAGAAMTLLRVAAPSDWANAARLAHAGVVDAWLLAGEVTDDAIRHIARWKRPFVVLGGHRCRAKVHSVDADHHSVGELAAHHMAGKKHHRVAFVGTRLRYPYQRGIRDGFVHAVKELGLDPDPRLIGHGNARRSLAFVQVARGILELDPKPTAIFAAEPHSAFDILNMLQEDPDPAVARIELVGCRISGDTSPPTHITYVELPYDELGRAGVAMLHGLVNGVEPAQRQHHILPSIATGVSTS